MRRCASSKLLPLLFYGWSAETIADWCHVSVDTARRYKRGDAQPSHQARALFMLYRDRRVLDGAFSRFLVRDGKLIDPAGYEFTPAVLEGYQSLLQWAHGMSCELGRSREYYQHLDTLARAFRAASNV